MSSNWNQYARLQYRGRQRANGSYVDRRKRLDERTPPAVDPRSVTRPGGGIEFNKDIADKDALWDDPYALIEAVPVDTIREAHRLYPCGSSSISPEDKLFAAVVRATKHQPRTAEPPPTKPPRDIVPRSHEPRSCAPPPSRSQHRIVRDATINLQTALNAFGADANWKPLMDELREAVSRLPEQP